MPGMATEATARHSVRADLNHAAQQTKAAPELDDLPNEGRPDQSTGNFHG